ncbi:hypothetical protein A7K93_09910, partial [Candidatus Methylacidiphilum fumarolicum]
MSALLVETRVALIPPILRWVLSGQCRNIEGQLVCFEGAYPFGALDEPAAYFDKSAHLSDLEE